MTRSQEEAPSAIFVAGPNGSGKSSVAVKIITGPAAANYICADNIARDLEAAGFAGSKQELARQASELAMARVEQALQARQDFTYETVMSHPSKPALMRQATNHGFTTELHYVATANPSINIDRVGVRVIKGGHDVPPEKTESRYHRSIGQLPTAIAAVKTAIIYDNSERPRLIATVDNEKRAVEVYNAPPEWCQPALQALAKSHTLQPAAGLSQTERLHVRRAISELDMSKGID